MLQSLYIQDYALIHRLQIAFEQGFSVITGETGAGKSIMLGAIGLLLGQRADSKAIRRGASKCVIEAHFRVEEEDFASFFTDNDLEFDSECILRREVATSGKSRAFINDTPVSLALLKELGERLVDIHSQHQNLLMAKEDFQLNVLDILAAHAPQLSAYRQTFLQWKQQQADLHRLEEEAAKAQSDADYMQFQRSQLEEAHLQPDEETALEQEAEMLAHAEEIKSGLYRAAQGLDGDEGGVLAALRSCRNALQGILKVYPAAEELYQRLESSAIELEDIASELEHHEEHIEFNPDRLEAVNDRLNLIYSLAQKHRVKTSSELLEIQASFQERLQRIDHAEEDILRLKGEVERSFRTLQQQAAQLTKERREAAAVLEKQMVTKLVAQGLPNVRFQVQITGRNNLSETGADVVNFLFSANKNGLLQPLAQVASGGEIARVMLAVKALISGAVHLPTLIFDEIDTGVSGNIADRMALLMQEMGEKGHQVISITHLPQIAARGKVHYKVYKEDNETETISYISRLNSAERVEELAHMLSGATLTPEALENAKALLGAKTAK